MSDQINLVEHIKAATEFYSLDEIYKGLLSEGVSHAVLDFAFFVACGYWDIDDLEHKLMSEV